MRTPPFSAELSEAVSAGLPEEIRSNNAPLLLDCLVECFAKEDAEPPREPAE